MEAGTSSGSGNGVQKRHTGGIWSRSGPLGDGKCREEGSWVGDISGQLYVPPEGGQRGREGARRVSSLLHSQLCPEKYQGGGSTMGEACSSSSTVAHHLIHGGTEKAPPGRGSD